MKTLLARGIVIGLFLACECCGVEDRVDDGRGRRIEVNQETLDGDDAFAPIEPLWWTVDIYSGPVAYEETLRPFAREQRLLFAIHWYRSEVNNGGHDQFYFNSTGIVWRDALAGFELLELAGFASVLRESADRLGGEPSLDRTERQEALERFTPDFDDLDRRFYALSAQQDLDRSMLTFMRSRPQAFAFDGIVEIP